MADIKSPDEVFVDTKKELTKGKFPRKFIILTGAAFILTVIGFRMLTSSKPATTDTAIQSKTATEPEQVKKDAQSDIPMIDAIAQSQAEEASKVKNQKEKDIALSSASDQGSDIEMPRDMKLPSGRYAEMEQNRQKERTAISPIFKSGGARAQSQTSGVGNPINAIDREIRSVQDMLNRTQQQPTSPESYGQAQINALKEAMGANPSGGRASASGEVEFNQSMEGKGLPSALTLQNKSQAECLVTAGWIIPAVNVNGMNSDLPGEVLATVREDVYDSLGHRCLVIPKGSKILLTYNPNVRVGQERFNIAATLLQLPNGKKINLQGMRGYDREGYAGLEADVNNHYFKIFGTSLLLGFIGKWSGNDTISTNNTNGSSTTNSTVLGQTLAETSRTMLERNRNIAPTLEIKQGSRFNLMVTREMFLEKYRD